MTETPKISIDEILKKITDTPQFSQTAMKLFTAVSDRNHSLMDIANIIKLDGPLTAKTLKAVNSAAFGLGQQVDTVESAVRYLGDAGVTALILSSEKVYSSNMQGYMASEGEIWKHSLRTAIAARIFMKLYPQENFSPEQAYTAGIIHDIGKTIISYYLSLLQIKPPKEEIENFESFEKDILGISHSEVGYLLAKKWDIPEPLCNTIRYHHTPRKAPEKDKALVYAVHIADIASMISGTGTGVDTMNYTIDQNYMEYFNMEEEDLDRALLEIEKEYTLNCKTIAETLMSL